VRRVKSLSPILADRLARQNHALLERAGEVDAVTAAESLSRELVPAGFGMSRPSLFCGADPTDLLTFLQIDCGRNDTSHSRLRGHAYDFTPLTASRAVSRYNAHLVERVAASSRR